MKGFDMEKIAFQTAIIHFSDEIFRKEMEVSNLQIRFMKTYENTINHTKFHPNLVKQSTKVISEVHSIINSISNHFSELKIQFAYTLFQKMFKLLIFSFKSLSQIYLQQNKHERLGLQKGKCQKEQGEFEKPQNNSFCGRKQFQQIQILNFVIEEIERRDLIFQKKLSKFQSQVKLQKQAVQNILSTNTTSKIFQIQAQFNDFINRIQDIFDNVFRFRHDELRKFIGQVDKPQRIDKSFCDEIKYKIKKQIIFSSQKIINKFILKGLKNRRNKNEKNNGKPNRYTVSPETYLNNTRTQNQKSSQLYQLKLQLFKLEKEKCILNNNLSNIEKKVKNLKKENQIIQELLKKKDMELQRLKVNQQWDLKAKQKVISKLNQKIQVFNQTISSLQKGEACIRKIVSTSTIAIQTQLFNRRVRKKSTKIETKANEQNFYEKKNFKNILNTIFKNVGEILNLPGQKQFVQKQFYNFQEVQKIINNWCEQVKKQKNFIKEIEKEKYKEKGKSKKRGKSKRMNSKLYESQKNSSTLAIKTDNSCHNNNNFIITRTPKTQATSRYAPSKKDSKKSQQLKNRFSQVTWVKKRKQKTMQNFDCDDNEQKTESDKQNMLQEKDFAQFLKKASFEEINIVKKGSRKKIRTSNVGLYLRNVSRKQSQNIIQNPKGK